MGRRRDRPVCKDGCAGIRHPVEQNLYQMTAAMVMASPEAKLTSLTVEQVEEKLRRHFPNEDDLRRRYPGDRGNVERAEPRIEAAGTGRDLSDLGFPPLDIFI